MTPKEIHLNLFAFGAGHHAAAWRAVEGSVEKLGLISWWEELARTAERGKLDAVFLADGSGEWAGLVFGAGDRVDCDGAGDEQYWVDQHDFQYVLAAVSCGADDRQLGSYFGWACWNQCGDIDDRCGGA